jgi:glycosyltransferase involved in cell wall biosynthesis
MTNVLFIALEFPPINSTGMYRSLKFVKYLKEYNINPIVLTLDLESGKGYFGNNINEELMNELPRKLNIYHFSSKKKTNDSSKIKQFINILLNKNENIVQNGWSSFKEKLKQIVITEAPSVVYVSLPPFSSNQMVQYIKSTYKLPIIVDMRDAWSHWVTNPYLTKFHYNAVFRKEKKLFKNATKIITVTDDLKKLFINTHKGIDANKFSVIPNGIDSEINYDTISISNPYSKNKISIGYIGSFYFNPQVVIDDRKPFWKKSIHKWFRYTPHKEDWLYRSPYFFLKILHEFLLINKDYKRKIVFEYIGHKQAWLQDMIDQFDLTENFISHGFLSRKEAMEIQNDFDFVLATSEKVVDGRNYCLPSKLFDYIQAQKPILGFITDGSQKDFLINSGMAIIFDPDNTKQSADRLKKLFSQDTILPIHIDYLNKFQRKNATATLALLVKEII